MLDRIVDQLEVKFGELEEYEESDHVQEYVESVGEPFDFVGCSTKSAYRDYREFCAKNGYKHVLATTRFGRRLAELYGMKTTTIYHDGKTVRIYSGYEHAIAQVEDVSNG